MFNLLRSTTRRAVHRSRSGALRQPAAFVLTRRFGESTNDNTEKRRRDDKKGDLSKDDLNRIGDEIAAALKQVQKMVQEEDKKNNSNNNSNRNNDDKGNGQSPWAWMPTWLKVAGGVLAAQMAYFAYQNSGGTAISPHTFIHEILPRGTIKRLQIYAEQGYAVAWLSVPAGGPNGGGGDGGGGAVRKYRIELGDAETFERRVRQAEVALGVSSEQQMQIFYASRGPLDSLKPLGATVALSALIVVGVRWFVSSGQLKKMGGGMSSMMGRNTKAKLYNKETNIRTRFADVAGLPEAKQEIVEFVEFLKSPERFLQLGAKVPRGAILCGPPGNGKTLLAKAAAGEAGVSFYVTSGAEFLEMFVGVGPARVRDLFKEARENAPAIVFIDEIDAIGRARANNKGVGSGAHDERESTLNALLVEMDGFSSNDNVVVLAGTNRLDVLDSALLRPGRFDRQIAIDNPDVKARAEIFAVHLKPIKCAASIDLPALCDRMARLTPGFSAADVANVCNEAALVAARANDSSVAEKHFDAAIERVIGGLEKKNRVLAPDERRTIAYHEAGHVVVAWMLEHCDPLLKISIVPRGQKPTGFTQYDSNDQFLLTREQLLDRVCQRLAGRAAEHMRLNVTTTASEDDLQYVTRLAYSQMSIYGMSETVGQVSFQGDGGRALYGDHTAEMIDTEVFSFVEAAYKRTCELVAKHGDAIDKIAEMLLDREVLTGVDMEAVLGPHMRQAQ